jgi:hypothetical protein
MIKENDLVVIYETKETGYVEKILDGGDRLMVRVPSSGSWPYPHHVYVVREKVRKAKGKSSSEEPLLQGE